METLGLMDKTLYDIGENDLLDVWDTDFATVRKGFEYWKMPINAKLHPISDLSVSLFLFYDSFLKICFDFIVVCVSGKEREISIL